MSGTTKLLPASAFTRKNAHIRGNTLQVSNYVADSALTCEVTGLVSFDWDRSNDFPIPTLETSAGKITLPQTGRGEQTYKFDTPYTGRIEISLPYLKVPGSPNDNAADFYNFQVLA